MSLAFSRIDIAEKILGYEFHDKGLIRSALTHPSAVEGQPVARSYERLEFFGDSILGAMVATDLFGRYPDMDEGQLTKIKIALVSGAMLSRVAEDMGLGECITFGESELGTDARGMHSALENVYESVVGALYLDAGFDVAHALVVRTLGPYVSRDLEHTSENAKSRLQEVTQRRVKRAPTYELVGQSGPAHMPTFTCAVLLDGKRIAEGSGHSKKLAETAAAEAALEVLTAGEKNAAKKG